MILKPFKKNFTYQYATLQVLAASTLLKANLSQGAKA